MLKKIADFHYGELLLKLHFTGSIRVRQGRSYPENVRNRVFTFRSAYPGSITLEV